SLSEVKSPDHPITRSPDHPSLPARFYVVLAAIAIFSVGNSSDMFLILRATDVGFTAQQAPLLGLVFNIVYTATSWPLGHLSDRLSRSKLAALGFVVFAIVYFTFGLAPSKAAIWAMMGFYGLYYSLTSPVLRGLISNTVAPEIRGRAFGLYQFVS